MIKDEYRTQDGCHNCKHVFVMREWDEGSLLYCNENKDRPRCQSVLLNECDANNSKEFPNRLKTWCDWADAHEVRPYGICNNYKKRKSVEE